MANKRIYLDYNASAPLRPEARAAMADALETFGNPSSIHAEGRAARGVVEEAREAVAALAGARARDVVFTSGATEGAALAQAPPAANGMSARLLIGGGEHPAVRLGQGYAPAAVETVALTGEGVLDLEALDRALAGEGSVRLALQAANNETGAIQPVAAAAERVHAAGGLVVCDAVQGAGRIDCRLETLGADALLFSAHKIGGPKGVGAVVTRPGLALSPVLRGGGQERGLRAGTENVVGIAGFGAAARACLAMRDAEGERTQAMRDALERGVMRLAPDAVIFSVNAPRLPNTSCFAVPGTDAALLLITLDLAGAAVSSGAACSSGKVASSAVLSAMGVAPDLAKGALRVSFGWRSEPGDVDAFLSAFEAALRRRRGR